MIVKFFSIITDDERVGKLLCFDTGGDCTNPRAICVDEQGLFHTAPLHTLRLVDISDSDFQPMKGGTCLNNNFDE